MRSDARKRSIPDPPEDITALGYRLNGVTRERDRLATRLAEVERERDALESLHDEWAKQIRDAKENQQ